MCSGASKVSRVAEGNEQAKRALLAKAGRVAAECCQMVDAVLTHIPEDEHRVQLRRAIVASTIGTAIEWYDFFLYSTVTGLVFAKLFFPIPTRWSVRLKPSESMRWVLCAPD